VNTSGAKVIDAAGKTVMPGLIDAHVHLFFDLQGQRYFPTSDSAARSYAEGRLREKLAAHLEAGFTTILSPIDFWPYIVDVKNQIRTGNLKGPRLLIAGGVFVSPGGHYVCAGEQGEAKRWCDEHISVPVNEPGPARDGVRRYAEREVDFIVYDSVTNAPDLNEPVIRALVDEAQKHGLRVLVHTSRVSGLERLVNWGVKGFVALPTGPRDAANSLTGRAVQRIPLGINYGGTEEAIRAGRATKEQTGAYEANRQNLSTILKAGAVPAFGSDLAGMDPRDVRRIVLRALSDIGLSNEDVLRASTRNTGQLLLGQKDLGTLEPGNVADIIIVDGNPLADLNALDKVQTVIRAGEIAVDKR
jgi:imidazolonepropionase-like amidohydrolase